MEEGHIFDEESSVLLISSVAATLNNKLGEKTMCVDDGGAAKFHWTTRRFFQQNEDVSLIGTYKDDSLHQPLQHLSAHKSKQKC